MNSKYADAVIQHLMEEQPDRHVVDIYEHYEHDGYDRYGPESDIMHLFIMLKSPDGTYEYRTYYTENWFHPKEEVAYDLVNYHTSPVSVHISQDSRDYSDEYGYDITGCFYLHRKLQTVVEHINNHGPTWTPEMDITEREFKTLTISM